MTLSENNLSYLTAFFGGVLLSFSPCIYPLIPVTIGFIGIKSFDAKLKSFLLSFTYVTGIAITYSMLGLTASLTGKLFGRISNHPLTNILVGSLIILFGISMLDIFPINLSNFIKFKLPSRRGYFSVLLIGLASGLLISPCLTPALGSILAYLSTRKNTFYGTTLLITFAYGMGLPLIIAGTFGTALLRSPRLNKWSVYIQKFCALVILAVGIYFVYNGLRRTW